MDDAVARDARIAALEHDVPDRASGACATGEHRD